jgi:hypothetical protein
MGSFNETCALSCLPITYGDPVKLLFLTRNPYSTTCDEHFAQRGCYHNDQWFVRTPPITGTYADYGKCDFEESYLTKLIEKTFSTDVVELPFGYNECHAPPVSSHSNIHQFLEAAWEGRLLVKSTEFSEPKIPENFPTWKKIHALLEDSKFPIMQQSEQGGTKGFNAQEPHQGIVTVYWNDYSETNKQLQKITPLLSKHYDVKPNKFGMENVLIVVPKGGFDNIDVFFDSSKIESILKCPKRSDIPKVLPVLAVMIRQDVWDLFKNIKYKSWTNQDLSLDEFKNKSKKKIDFYVEQAKTEDTSAAQLAIGPIDSIHGKATAALKQLLAEFNSLKVFMEDSKSMPFQTSISEHYEQIPNLPLPLETEIDNLITSCGELNRVEMIMSISNHSWQIPSTSGQETNWNIQKNINSGIAKIAQMAKKAEDEQ